MGFWLIRDAVLVLALGPFIYYALTLWAGILHFRRKKQGLSSTRSDYTPPVSILKPVRGLDREAYENFASFCRLDYPEYEILFCVSDEDDPVVPVIEKLQQDFPNRGIRLFVGAPGIGASSKVNKLCRLVEEANHELLVISDSDVRVEANYLRDVAAPFADPKIGAVTVFFRSLIPGSFGATLDASGSAVEFATSALLAQRLEGIRFTLGATMATTKERLAEIGGFRELANRYVDDFELGNRIAARGYRVELACTPVWMVYPRETLSQFLRHRPALDDSGGSRFAFCHAGRALRNLIPGFAQRGVPDAGRVGAAGSRGAAGLVAGPAARCRECCGLAFQLFLRPDLLARA